MLQLTLIGAKTPMSKFVTSDGRVLPALTSPRISSETIQAPDLLQCAPALIPYAERGWGLLGGSILDDEVLRNVSRAGKVPPTTPSHLLRLDLDGVRANSKGTLQARLSNLLRRLQIADCHHLVHWSSRAGLTEDIRAHVLFELDEPTSPPHIRWFLRQLNLNFLESSFSLNDSGLSLHYPIDIALAGNAQLLFLGDPVFEEPSQDPFQNQSRWKVNRRKHPKLTIPEINEDEQESIKQRERLILDNLREAHGYPPLPAKLKSRKIQGEQVLTDTFGTKITEAWGDGEFLRFNLNGGDSHAYYSPVDNPKLVFSFKPGEPIFRLEDLAGEFAEHVKELVKQYKKRKKAESEKPSIEAQEEKILVMGVDENTGSYFTTILQEGVWQEPPMLLPRIAAMDIYMDKAQLRERPTFVPAWKLVFDPQEDPFNLDKRFINLYAPTKIESKPGQHPTIDTFLNFVLPGGETEIAWFLNWFAFLCQKKKKPITSLVLQGALGTGKNLLAEEILFPVLGKRNCMTLTQDSLSGQYMDFLGNYLFFHVEEIDMSNFSRKEKANAMRILRSLITGQEQLLRPIRAAFRPIELRAAFIMSSNRRVPIAVDLNDRRISFGTRQEESLLGPRSPFTGWTFGRLKTALRNDLPAFVHTIQSLEVDEDLAATPLSNAAQRYAWENAAPIEDQVAQAIATENGDFFITAWEDRELLTTYINDPIAKAYREFLTGMIAAVHYKKRHFVPTPTWVQVFSYLCELKDSKHIGWITRRYNIGMNRVARVDGITRRGCSIKWTVDPTRLKEWVEACGLNKRPENITRLSRKPKED